MQTRPLTMIVDRPEDGRRLAVRLVEFGWYVRTVVHGKLVSEGLDDLPVQPLLVSVTGAEAGALALCRDLRHRRPEACICLLFERADETTLTVALEIGADAVLVEPVEPRRLSAQLRALVRGLTDVDRVYRCDDLTIDMGDRSALRAGRPLTLTDSEFDLLRLLARRPGRVLDRDTIMQEIRGLPHDARDRSIDLTVVRLRRKLGDDAHRPRYIKTVRGRGYMLVRPAR